MRTWFCFGRLCRMKILFGVLFVATVAFIMIYNSSDMIRVVSENMELIRGQDSRRKTEEMKEEIRKESVAVCETSYIGCYKKMTKLNWSTQKERYKFMTPKWCISFCYSNDYKFAAIEGKDCLCSKQFHHVADIRSSSNQCNTVCAGAGAEAEDRMTCGGEKSVEAYFIKGQCVKTPFTLEYAASRRISCIKTPRTGFPRISDVTSSTECLTLCQVQGHPLALYSRKQKCWCGKADRNYDIAKNFDSCNTSEMVDVFRTLVEDKRCGNISFLPPGKYKRTELSSYPGSGNTWTRYLLEKATGYYTGSVYNDEGLSGIGYLGESFKVEETRTDLIKDHFLNDKKVPEFPAAFIVIVRNPYKAIVSLINFINAKSDIHVNSASDQVVMQKIGRTMPKKVNNWIKFHQKVLSQDKPLLVVYYEDIVADPISSVRKMVEFLPNPALHPSDLDDRLACLSQETTGLARRKPRKYSSDFFPAEIRKSVNKAVGEVRELLRKRGIEREMPPYEKGPDLDW